MGYSEEMQKALEEALLECGRELANPPSAIDELLSLLTKAEHVLSYVYQRPARSMEVLLLPVMQALITDQLLKHADLNVQVAVAACTSEVARITAPDFPYIDEHMKEIFGLFMVAFKQLSCEPGENYKKALQILDTVAAVRSCLIMLDIEADPMIVNMFQLFLDTISHNHSADVFDHMKTIMILIVKESDEISSELLRPLLSSVKMDNKNTSPRSWELGKSVFENCATILQQYVKEAVKAMNLNVDDYAEIVASLCQDAPVDMGANEEIAGVQVANEEIASVQVANEEVENVQVVKTDASGDGPKLNGKSEAGPKMEIKVERRRREIKPNTLMRPEEGYEHPWSTIGSSSYRTSYYSDNKDEKDSLLPSEIGNAKMPSDSSQKEIASIKKASKKGESKKQESIMNQGSVEEVSPKPTKKILQYKVKEKGTNKPKKTTEGVIAESSAAGIEKEQINHGAADSQGKDDSAVISGKHGVADVVEKVVESPMSETAKAKQSKVKEKGFKKAKKTTKAVIVESSAVGIEKEQLKHSAADLQEKDENKITSQKHEAGVVVDKVVESPMSKPMKAKQSDVKEKGSNIGKKTTKRVVGSVSVGAEKEQANHSVDDSKREDENEITSQKHESGDTVDKVVESPISQPAKAKQSKVKEKGFNIRKKTTKRVVVRSGSVSGEREQASHSVNDSNGEDENEIASQKHESGDAVDKVVESPASQPAKVKQSKVKEKGSNIQKKTTKRVVASGSVCAEKEKAKHSVDDSNGEDENEIASQKHESGDAVGKVVESPMSQPAKVKQSKVKEKGSKIQKKTTEQVVASGSVCAEKEKANHSVDDSKGEDENEIASQKHESGDAVDKVVDSPVSQPAKAKQSRVKQKGSNKRKKTNKRVVVGSSSVGAEKEQADHSVDDSKGEDENEIASEKHESGDAVDKLVESSMSQPARARQSKVKEKGSIVQKKTTKRDVVGPCSAGAQKLQVYHSFDDSKGKNENKITTHEKDESTDVLDKVVESGTSKPPKAAKQRGHSDPENEKSQEPMDFRLEYGRELVNLRIMVWWPIDKTYYTGTVESFDPVTKKHKIKYDDDEEEVLDMSEERWELFSERQSRQSSSKREAEHPSPAKEPGKIKRKITKRKAGSSRKEHAGASSKRSRSEGVVKAGYSAAEPILLGDELDDETPEAIFSSLPHDRTRKNISKRKAGSSKEHAGSSSKRSKSEGPGVVKSGHSEPEPIPVQDDSGDEAPEAISSWKDRAKVRAGKEGLKTAKRKGKPTRSASNGVKID